MIDTKQKANEPVSDDVKHLICINLNDGKAVSDVAITFGVSLAMVYAIKRKALFAPHGNLVPLPKRLAKPGPKSVFDPPKNIIRIYELVNSRPTATLKELVAALDNEGIKTSVSSLQRFLESAKIT